VRKERQQFCRRATVGQTAAKLLFVLYLFDIDGTLIGGDGAGRRAFDRACFECFGVKGALDHIKLDGMTDPLILECVYIKHVGRSPTPAESDAVMRTYLGYLEPEVATARYLVHDGVPEVLDLLESRGCLLGLATGNLEEGARIKLERGGLWKRFAFGGFGSDAPPHDGGRTELVKVAIARGHARASGGRRFAREEMVVIGDTPRDIAAAHAAGSSAVGVATGSFSVDALRAAGADAAFPSMREWMATL
jgi:phosphoglycolate phosphatase